MTSAYYSLSPHSIPPITLPAHPRLIPLNSKTTEPETPAKADFGARLGWQRSVPFFTEAQPHGYARARGRDLSHLHFSHAPSISWAFGRSRGQVLISISVFLFFFLFWSLLLGCLLRKFHIGPRTYGIPSGKMPVRGVRERGVVFLSDRWMGGPRWGK